MATHLELISSIKPFDARRKSVFRVTKPLTMYKKVYKLNDVDTDAIAVLEVPVGALIHVNIKENGNIAFYDEGEFLPLLTDKVRVNRAFVKRIYSMKSGRDLQKARSFWNRKFIYRTGTMVRPRNKFAMTGLCASGIHCYRRQKDAKEY